MSLPSGTVTFLFTDIEGSTRLWEEHPDAMRVALARHDEIAASVIREFVGTLVKSRGEGDSLFAVFPLAADAVAASCALQMAFAREPWPESLSLKVRIALHTGDAGFREGDYYGQAVNRCARLRAIGHGGQVLLSDVAHDLCRDSLPAGYTLKPLGEHQLKDLGRPESVFQLCHPELPADFPPLRSLDNPELPNNLPRQPTSFIGREKEVEQVKKLLRKSPLVTLTGSGGCGKTRLALQVAADMLDLSGDGVWLAELAPLADPALVPSTVASALGVKEEPGRTAAEALLSHLKSRRLLLILDNCEHLLEACARLADSILRGCPHVLILATSREGLGIAGELTYRVPSLSSPDPKRDSTPFALSQFEAVRLFIERAQFHQPQFAVTSQNAPALASVCHRLDGIPLAIELAAARIRSLSVEEVNEKLDQRFRLLTGGSRTALPRQQTLRSLIDWSYNLLNEAEKALLCRLSVFAGGWTLESAEQVCAGEPVEEWETLDLLTSLSDKSLAAVEERGGRSRYRLLETVRQYSRDRLLETGDGETWRNRHLAHFTALAEEAEPHLWGPEQRVWLDKLDAEHDNLRAALEWSAESDREAGLRLAGSLGGFWRIRGHYREGRERLESALGGGRSAAARAKVLYAAGSMARIQADYAAARGFLEESLEIARERDDLYGTAKSLTALGNAAFWQADYETATGLYEESLAFARNVDDKSAIATSLSSLGGIAINTGDYAAARELYEQSAAIYWQMGNQFGIRTAPGNLGLMHLVHGDPSTARALFEESLGISREVGHAFDTANACNNVAMAALSMGDTASARASFAEALSLGREMGAPVVVAEALEGLASVAASGPHVSVAARLWGAAARYREEFRTPQEPYIRRLQEPWVAAARAALGDEAFDAACQEGRAMERDDAFALALEKPDA